MKLPLVLLMAAFLTTSASASQLFTFNGVVAGNQENATALFTFGPNTVTVAITDLIQGPIDVGQNVAGITFTLSGGLNTGTLTGVSGQLANISNTGVITNVAGTPDWFQMSPPALLTSALGASGPDNTLIGSPCQPSGTYSCSNGSINGNPSHNPFTTETITLSFNIPGVNSDTTVTALQLAFGTIPTWTDPFGTTTQSTPEPGGVMTIGAGLVALAGMIRRRMV